MKQRNRFLAVLLCVALLLPATACKKQEEPEITEPVIIEEDAATRYQRACDDVNAAADLTVEVEYNLHRTIGDDVYSEQMMETVTYRGLGTKKAVASVKQQVAFGPYQTQYAELYSDGMAYCRTNDSTFKAKMTIGQFCDRQIPAILINAALYKDVIADKLDNNTVITFSKPKKIESWATDYTKAVLESAVATVTLNEEGSLTDATYTARYSCGTTVYDLQVKTSVKLEVAQSLDDDLAALPEKCYTLSYFDAPRKILQVVGDVYTASAMSAEYTESVYSAAFARSRTRTSECHIYGTGSDFMARRSYRVVNTDYSNTPSVTSEDKIFRNGSCTSSLNGAEPVPCDDSAVKMRNSCEDEVLAALFTPNHLKEAELTETKGQLRIAFTGKTTFADKLCSSIYSIFGANLDLYAQSYTTPVAGGYLCIDKASGLPTALGVLLEREHVAGEVSYTLTYQLDQTMQLSSEKAYDNIVDPPTQPETTPTESTTNP